MEVSGGPQHIFSHPLPFSNKFQKFTDYLLITQHHGKPTKNINENHKEH